MSIEEIKELIRVVQETGIAELEVHRGDSKVRILRSSGSSQEVITPVVSLPVAATPAQVAHFHPAAIAAAAPPPPEPEPEPEADERNLIVKSPIVGTYYDSPSPGAAPFVKVGDRVSQKQVLCIIESMKLMNEIEAEVAGTVMAKFVENGRPVEYGESLFSIRP
jgi:acetyl-CoA carboxylase biotin carboxyl carrier protein